VILRDQYRLLFDSNMNRLFWRYGNLLGRLLRRFCSRGFLTSSTIWTRMVGDLPLKMRTHFLFIDRLAPAQAGSFAHTNLTRSPKYTRPRGCFAPVTSLPQKHENNHRLCPILPRAIYPERSSRWALCVLHAEGTAPKCYLICAWVNYVV
jgi:hypothetical protein